MPPAHPARGGVKERAHRRTWAEAGAEGALLDAAPIRCLSPQLPVRLLLSRRCPTPLPVMQAAVLTASRLPCRSITGGETNVRRRAVAVCSHTSPTG